MNLIWTRKKKQMISVKDAFNIVLNESEDFGVEKTHFLNTEGRVLKEPVFADRDFPPFNRVSMDGIAISLKSFQKGQHTFAIEGIQPAGSSRLSLKNSTNCIEVMTGAILPAGCDAVIPYEKVTIKDRIATLLVSDIKPLQNVHLKGKDRKEPSLLIAENTLISSAYIGVFATFGVDLDMVANRATIGLISPGVDWVVGGV